MLAVDILGWRSLQLEYLVLDVNGTLTCDGVLLPGVRERISLLRSTLQVSLLSADTLGRLDSIAADLNLKSQCLVRTEPEADQKANVVQQLGPERVIAIGNGANDVSMLEAAALGIAVLGPEGLAVGALQAADVVVASIDQALDLLLSPRRLVATLRR